MGGWGVPDVGRSRRRGLGFDHVKLVVSFVDGDGKTEDTGGPPTERERNFEPVLGGWVGGWVVWVEEKKAI